MTLNTFSKNNLPNLLRIQRKMLSLYSICIEYEDAHALPLIQVSWLSLNRIFELACSGKNKKTESLC